MSSRAMFEDEMRPSQISAIARLFSAGVIRELGKRASSPLFARLLADIGISETISSEDTVRKAFDEAFSHLKKTHCRHEYIYKAALAHKVLLGTHSLNTATMLTEFRVGPCKADVVILNGASTVYEIKSERDKLDRLVSQVGAYQKVFSLTNVIVGQNHLDEALSLLPSQVGILILSDRFQISTFRPAYEDLTKLDAHSIFDVMRRSEAERVIEEAGFIVPDVPNTRRYQVVSRIFQRLTPAQAHQGMVSVLRETRSQKRLSEVIGKMPGSLRAAVLSASLRDRGYQNVLTALDIPIKQAASWK